MENERQRNVILLIDEVYVKPSLTYQGGTVFGKAVNMPGHLANTLITGGCNKLGWGLYKWEEVENSIKNY